MFIDRISNIKSSESFKSRPGYAYALGCENWSASGNKGKVEGWNGGNISWLVTGQSIKSCMFSKVLKTKVVVIDYCTTILFG